MREPSFMIVIPKKQDDIHDLGVFLSNLEKSEFITLVDTNMDEGRGLIIDLCVEDRSYQIVAYPTMVQIPSYVRSVHSFTKKESEAIDAAESGLAVTMDFAGDTALCFHDQLRIINAMFPEILAVLDCPSEKLLSGRWVAMAAESETLPSPRYLFTVQAVSDESGEVWLHSHGLKRAGMYELEILGSDEDTYNTHYQIIETFAYRLLENGGSTFPGDPVYIGQAAGHYLVGTAVDWKEALQYYPNIKVGTEEDREDGVHDEDTCVIMLYRNTDDAEKRNYTQVQAFNPLLKQNPVFLLSTQETERMKSLAIERFSFAEKGFKNKDNVVIVKIGVITDKEHWNGDTPQKEHMWFDLKEVREDGIVATLTNEPYYISGLKKGDTALYPYEDITDWIIYTPEGRITPDDVYLLNE